MGPPHNELGMKRQFMRGQKESLPGPFFGDPFHLIKNTTWSDNGYPIFRSALSLPHPGFRRFLSNRFVRENANPDPAGPLDESGHGDSSSFNLPGRQPTAFDRLQSEVAKVEGIPSGSHSSPLSLLLLSIFRLLRHQHNYFRPLLPASILFSASGFSFHKAMIKIQNSKFQIPNNFQLPISKLKTFSFGNSVF
jgi:hypothetical protein